MELGDSERGIREGKVLECCLGVVFEYALGNGYCSREEGGAPEGPGGGGGDCCVGAVVVELVLGFGKEILRLLELLLLIYIKKFSLLSLLHQILSGVLFS